jgi:ribosomal RNA-processing protein 1
MRVPTSLAYHLADIYLEELDKAIASSPAASPLPAPLLTLLSPFFELVARTPNNTTYKRVQSALFDPLFDALKPGRSDNPDIETLQNIMTNACLLNPHADGGMGSAALRKALLRRIFEVASDQQTRDSNRRKMYAFWKDNAEDDDQEDSVG